MAMNDPLLTDRARVVRPVEALVPGKTLFEGPRFLANRQMLLNRIVHYRAQLGVYSRLNGTPLPGTYGLTADDMMGL